eukprot:scaffold954_cov173-Ochromonas_danica.AAC.6
MPIIDVGGIPVDFPRDPYDCQVGYMRKVIEALSGGANALLESPTGTGKTLSLLCSTLAWQRAQSKAAKKTPGSNNSNSSSQMGKKKSVYDNISSGSSGYGGSGSGSGRDDGGVGVIIYATRTHTQLDQVIQELENTSYRPKMSVLGSREQLCIHEKVSRWKGSKINHACQMLTTRRGCHYKNNMDNTTSTTSSSSSAKVHKRNNAMLTMGTELGIVSDCTTEYEVQDIEDLVKMGRQKQICPYFYSREASATADIVFMPYNYLLDSSIRKTIKINLEDAIVIFDEAHNLERVASDAASCSFTSTDIASSIQEMQQVLAILKEEIQGKQRDNNLTSTTANSGIESIGFTGGSSSERPSLEVAINILKALFTLEKAVDQITLSVNQATGTSCAILPGVWLVNTLIQAGFNNEMIVEGVKRCVNMLVEEAEHALDGNGMTSSSSATPSALATDPKLNTFAIALDRILYTGRIEHQDFQVFISEEESKGKRAGGGGGSNILHYYQNNSRVALKELKAQGVRSLVLTSGTLSPLDAMKEDLKLPFTIELQNPHVIRSNQVYIAAIGRGSKEKTLNSSYIHRNTTDYKDELGQTIMDISCLLLGTTSSSSSVLSSSTLQLSSSEQSVIRGGVLVFFPAYNLLDSTIERWKFTGLYKQLQAIGGAVIVESKGSSSSGGNGEMMTTINKPNYQKGDSYEMVKRGSSSSSSSNADDEVEQESLQGLIAQFETVIKHKGSCILLAVCRGKVAEGVDFSDNKGRIVIVTGIPFAPYMDPWVVLKKQYLDEKSIQRSKMTAPLLPQHPMKDIKPPQGIVGNSVNVYAARLAEQEGGSAVSSNIWATARQSLSSSSIYTPNSSSITANTTANTTATTTSQSVMSTLPTADLPQQPNASLAAVTADLPNSATINNNKNNNQPKAAGSSVAFNGQMWYHQSASRAVNQCLGRVIRHKNDWGAIFLLDERFLADRQLSQLSSWMRPMVKKYSKLKDAMTSFSGYLQTIARDSSLRPPIEESAVEMLPPNARPRAIPMKTTNDEIEAFTRFVEISETQLPSSDEPACYIQQNLLLSQPNPSSSSSNSVHTSIAKESSSSSSTRESLDIDFLLSQQSTTTTSTVSQMRNSKGSSDMVGRDLKSKLDRLKSRDGQVVDKAPTSRLLINSSTTATTTSQINPLVPSFLRLPPHLRIQQEQQQSTSTEMIDLVMNEDENQNQEAIQSFGLHSTTIPIKPTTTTTASSSFSQQGYNNKEEEEREYEATQQSTSASQVSLLRSKISSFNSLAMTSKSSSNSNSNSNNTDPLKAMIGKWKEKLSEKQQQQIRDLLLTVKQEGGLRFPTKIKNFQEDFLVIIGNSLSLEEQTAALKAMASITTGTASIEIYNQLVLQRYQRLLKKRRSEQLEREEKAAFDLREAAEKMTKLNQPPSSSSGSSGSCAMANSNPARASIPTAPSSQLDDDIKPTTHSLGSKRAKQLLQMANITPTPSKQITEDHPSVSTSFSIYSDAFDCTIIRFIFQFMRYYSYI